MNRDFNLIGYGTNETLQFSWDDESGEVTGRDAAYVISAANWAKERGSVTSHPWPSTYYVSDPLRSLSDMAVVLGCSWRLTDELERHHPAPPGDAWEGFDDGGTGIRPIY